jgi:hypothetical protein
MDSDSPRLRVLRAVNEVFRQEALPLWKDIRRIGKHREDEFEITGVVRVIRDLREYYVTIVFAVIRPDGTSGEYAVRFSQPAAIVVPVIHVRVVGERVFFVKQHRLTIGKWTTELPRGWIRQELSGGPPPSAAVPEATVRDLLSREVGEEWARALVIESLERVGEIPEDTGTDSLIVPIYLVRGQTSAALPGRCGVHKPIAYDWATVHRLEDEDVINDAHTLAALRKAERHLAQQGGRRAEGSRAAIR